MIHKSALFLLIAGISLQLHAGTAWLIGIKNVDLNAGYFKSSAKNHKNIFDGTALYSAQVAIPGFGASNEPRQKTHVLSETIIPWESAREEITIRLPEHKKMITLQEKNDHKVHLIIHNDKTGKIEKDKTFPTDSEYILVIKPYGDADLIKKDELRAASGYCYCSTKDWKGPQYLVKRGDLDNDALACELSAAYLGDESAVCSLQKTKK